MSATAKKSSQAYDALERMIIFQDLAPGSLVSEVQLGVLTGFGRTPLREALQRLAGDRLIEVLPRRGIFIASLSIESQLNLLELRRPLEEVTVRLAARRINIIECEGAARCAKEFDSFTGQHLEKFERILRVCHELLVDSAHNEYLRSAMAPLQGLSRRFWFANLQDPKTDVQTAATFHSEILRAVVDGNEEKSVVASHRLTDYLTEFAFETLRRR